MAFNLTDLTAKVTSATATKVNEGFKPLESGIYVATLNEFGVYENNFKSNSLFIEVGIVENGEERKLTLDRGLTLKDGKDNEGTLSLIKEVFAATGVDISATETGASVVKTWGKEVQLQSFKECYGKEITAFVRETFEEGAKYDKGNIIENIFNPEGINSAGESQVDTFKKKIAEKPVLIKKPRVAKTGAGTGTASSPAAGSAATKRL
jgi:hypothetical protein